jgi:hypothetical protein
MFKGRGLSSRWRGFFLFVFAVLPVLVIWRLVQEHSAARGAFAWLAVPLSGVSVTALFGLAARVNVTQKILWWVFVVLVSVLGLDIFKLLHHSLTRDPFLTIFTDALWIVICVFWVRRHPFELKT